MLWLFYDVLLIVMFLVSYPNIVPIIYMDISIIVDAIYYIIKI